MRFKLAPLVFIVIFFAYAKEIFACSCASVESPSENIKKYSNVFSGKVVDISKPPEFGKEGSIVVTFKVYKVWKGGKIDKIHVKTPGGVTACGYDFKLNKDYFVYAGSVNGGLFTSSCSQTKLLNQAQNDIAELGVGESIIEISNIQNFKPVQNIVFVTFISLTGLLLMLFLYRDRNSKPVD